MTICDTAISTNELEVRYGTTVALTDVNLQVPEGALPVSYTHLTLPTKA